MDKVLEEIELNNDENVDYKSQLMELKNKLKLYKYLKNGMNVAFFASLFNFFYTHFATEKNEYISASVFVAILLSKLYLENKIDDKERECQETEIKIKNLK